MLIEKIEKWCKDLSDLSIVDVPEDCKELLQKTYMYKESPKYIKVYYKAPGTESVFAFVDYDGNIYKAAGWKAPAKGIRGHIDNPPMSLHELYRRG